MLNTALNKKDLLLEITSKYFELTPSELNFQNICDDFHLISGAKFTLLNRYNSKSKKSKTVAASGINQNFKKALNFINFDPLNKEYLIDDEEYNKLNTNKYLCLGRLEDLNTKFPKSLTKALTKIAGLGKIYAIGLVSKGKFLGNLIMIFGDDAQEADSMTVEYFGKLVSELIARTENEKKLEEERAKLKIISEYSPDLLFILDKNYKTLYVNRTRSYNKEEVVYENVLKFVPEYFQNTFLNLFQSAIEEKVAKKDEIKMKDRNGADIIYSIQFIPFAIHEQVEYIYLILTDITLNKSLLNELEESKLTFEKASAIANLGAWEFTFATKQYTTSESIANIFGAKKGETYTYEDIQRTVSQEEKVVNNELIQKAIETKETVIHESKRTILDGNQKWLRHYYKIKFEGEVPVGIIGITQDITELKALEESKAEVMKQFEQFQFALNQSSIVFKTNIHGVITFVNDNYLLKGEFKKEELIGKHFEFFSKNPDKSNQYQLGELLTGNVWRGEIQNLKKSGETYWLDTYIVAISKTDSEVSEYLFIQNDITNAKLEGFELEETKNRLNNVLSSIDDAVWSIDMKRHKMIYINPAGEKLFKKSLNDINESFDSLKNFFFLINKDMKEMQKTQLFEKGFCEYESEFESEDESKTTMYFYNKAWATKDEKGNVIRIDAVTSDITERKKAQLDLDKNIKIYEKLMKHVPGRIFQFKVNSDNSTQFLYISQKEINLVGIPTPDLFENSKLAWKNVHFEDVPILEKAIFESSKALLPIDIQFRIYEETINAYSWKRILAKPEADVNGSVVLYGTFLEIDEQKANEKKMYDAQEEAKQSSKFIRKIISQVPGVIFELQITENGDADFTFYSDTLEEDGKINVAKTPHLHQIFDLIHPDDKEILFALIDQSLESIESINIQLRLKSRKTDQYSWKILQATPERADNGKIIFYGYLGSIDEMKLAQVKLMEAKLEAEKANKAKSEFLANMSHEIRTPLNAVIGFSELLKGNTTEPKYEKYLDGILAGGKNLLSLINDILDLSKIEAGHLNLVNAPVDLNKLIFELEQLFSHKAEEKGVKFVVDVNQKIPKNVLIDETRIRQILFNLIGNAIKFTSKGEIDLIVDFHESEIDNSKINLIFKVKDSGIGIPLDQQKIIFEAFKQMDGQSTRKYGGTGLGLSITKRLVDMMEGRIEVESEVGKGSIFSVIISHLSIASVSEVTEGRNEYVDVIFNGQTILLVEDIHSNRQVVRAFLEKVNLDVITAKNGQEALEILKDRHPDLILMDMMMPIMDGYAATKAIRSMHEFNHIPIIALTASALTQDELGIRNLCNDYLRKPINKQTLIKTISKFLLHQEADNSNPNLNTISNNTFDIQVSQELKNELKQHFNEHWIEVSELMSIDDISTFANRLSIFAKERNNNELETFAIKMKYYADNFEIDIMNDFFKHFETLMTN